MKLIVATLVTAGLFAGSAMAADQTELAKKSNCLTCHAVDKKIVGPAYKDVAKKYKGDKTAEAKLIEKVKKGGAGNWTAVTGGVPMPPNPAVSDADLKKLVDWILAM